MTKKGKKGQPQKRGKTSGKPKKKQLSNLAESDREQTSTPQSELEELTIPGTSNNGVNSPAPNPTSPPKQPSVLVQKCEELEKLAASIQKTCITPHIKSNGAEKQPENVREMKLLVTEIKKLAQNVNFEVTPPPPIATCPEPTEPIVFYDKCPSKWPNNKMRVPHLFVHPPVNLRHHIRDMVASGIKVFYPQLETHYSKMLCPTFEDHQKLINFLEERNLPHHTFGHPGDRMLKVVIRGLSNDVDLEKVREDLIACSIPVVRFIEMKTKRGYESKYKTVMVIVPDSVEGRKVLKVKSIYGEVVKVERPQPKSKQCHRCQKWGHAQRHCQGLVRCVKCAGEHYSDECNRDPSKEPPKCANCSGEHTASYRKCPHCPDSNEYKEAQIKKKEKGHLLRVVLPLNRCPEE